MKTSPSFGPPQPASRGSSLGATALTPTFHRESSESLGGRLRRSGCDGCGNCCCGEDQAAAADPVQPDVRRSRSLTGWLADRPWLFVVGAFALLIGVWTTFITLALQNPVRDVLKNPLTTATDVRAGH
jgi:hypothetical protein